MRKMNLFIMCLLMTWVTSLRAADYDYLVFTLTDGSTQSIGVTGLKLSFSNGQLTATNGTDTFVLPLASLSKMQFSNDGAAGIETIDSSQLTIGDDADIYDLQGRKVSKEHMRKGVYIVKTKNKTWKISL